MQLSRETNLSPYQIQTYQESSVIINGKSYTESLLLTHDQLICPWGPPTIELLTPQHFQALLTFKPELVILGTGKTLCFPSPHLWQSLIEARIGVEVMHTGAACRTYTLLSSEGRNVIAILLITRQHIQSRSKH